MLSLAFMCFASFQLNVEKWFQNNNKIWNTLIKIFFFFKTSEIIYWVGQVSTEINFLLDTSFSNFSHLYPFFHFFFSLVKWLIMIIRYYLTVFGKMLNSNFFCIFAEFCSPVINVADATQNSKRKQDVSKFGNHFQRCQITLEMFIILIIQVLHISQKKLWMKKASKNGW